MISGKYCLFNFRFLDNELVIIGKTSEDEKIFTVQKRLRKICAVCISL